MATTPRKKAPYGTVAYYRDRITRWQEELALGRYRHGPVIGQPHGPDRIRTLRKWIKNDRDKLMEAFANQRAATGDTLALRRLKWIHHVRARRDEAERLAHYVQALQRNLERIEQSLRVGAPAGQVNPKRYSPSTLKSFAVQRRRGRKLLEKTLAQVAALPSKAPIRYREWSRLATVRPMNGG
jgi:hypothetical protein